MIDKKDISARLEAIVAAAKKGVERSASYANAIKDSGNAYAAECGGLQSTIEHMIEDVQKLSADCQPRGKKK